jgi:hypothetical protein
MENIKFSSRQALQVRNPLKSFSSKETLSKAHKPSLYTFEVYKERNSIK